MSHPLDEDPGDLVQRRNRFEPVCGDFELEIPTETQEEFEAHQGVETQFVDATAQIDRFPLFIRQREHTGESLTDETLHASPPLRRRELEEFRHDEGRTLTVCAAGVDERQPILFRGELAIWKPILHSAFCS